MATEMQESFSVDNAEVSLLISFPQLLDLALGTPEVKKYLHIITDGIY